MASNVRQPLVTSPGVRSQASPDPVLNNEAGDLSHRVTQSQPLKSWAGATSLPAGNTAAPTEQIGKSLPSEKPGLSHDAQTPQACCVSRRAASFGRHAM